MTLTRLFQCTRGAALLEYSLLSAGVALISAAAVSMYGHKTNDMIASVAAILPCAHADDAGPIASGKLIETTPAGSGQVSLDVATIVANTDTPRLENNMGVTALGTLILEQ
ncbi:MAG: hypothetical protein AAFU73_13975 [Planctomycetota bacterium]